MPIKAMRSSSRIGIAAQEKALVTLSTQLSDDRPKQPAADAAILVCRKKGKHQYFARCVLPEAEPDYRRTIDADVPRKQPDSTSSAHDWIVMPIATSWSIEIAFSRGPHTPQYFREPPVEDSRVRA